MSAGSREIDLIAVAAGQVDRGFRSAFAQARYDVKRGEIDKIVVVVSVDGTDFVHTVGAVTSAVSGQRLPDGAAFRVMSGSGDVELVDRVTVALAAALGPVEPVLARTVEPAVEVSGGAGSDADDAPVPVSLVRFINDLPQDSDDEDDESDGVETEGWV